jgi:hypothetical protein
MATFGYVESLLGGLESLLKRPLLEAFRYVVGNGRFGPASHQAKSESFQAYYQESTTSDSTSEFSVAHGMGRIPYLAVQVLPLDVVGAQLVPLTVTRAADAQRVYLKTEAGSTSAPFILLVE